MTDVFQDTARWLKEDHERWLKHDFKAWSEQNEQNGRTDKKYSAIVRYIFNLHRQSFRVKTKSLCREMVEAGNLHDRETDYDSAKRKLACYLIEELNKNQRITGKRKGEGNYQIGPLLKRKEGSEAGDSFEAEESLAVLLGRIDPSQMEDEGKKIKKEFATLESVKKTLAKLHEKTDAIGDIEEDIFINLASDMLKCDQPQSDMVDGTAGTRKRKPRGRNTIERIMELLEDMRRGNVMLNGKNRSSVEDYLETEAFAEDVNAVKLLPAIDYKQALPIEDRRSSKLDLFKKALRNAPADMRLIETLLLIMAIEEANEKMVNLENAYLKNYIPGSFCNESIGVELIKLYQTEGKDHMLCKDLRVLFSSTKSESQYVNMFMPVEIDEMTGVGLYLVGRAYMNAYDTGQQWTANQTTIVAIDHRLSEPHKLLDRDLPIYENLGNNNPLDTVYGFIQDNLPMEQLALGIGNNEYRKINYVRHNTTVVTLKEFSDRELPNSIPEVYKAYKKMSELSLERLRESRKNCAPPKECPERFVDFFIEPAASPTEDRIDNWKREADKETALFKRDLVPYR